MRYLIQLRSFIDVYRAGSISKAAVRLGISQPAVSSHIHSLESFAGKRLFRRSSHGVIPTPEGEELARLISHDFDSISSKLATLRSYSKGPSGTISIMGPAELLWAKLSSVIPVLAADEIRFNIFTGNRKGIYAGLSNGGIHLAFTTSRPDEQRYSFKEIGRERLIIISSSSREDGILKADDFLEALLETPLIAYDSQLPLIREMFRGMPEFLLKLRPSLLVPDLRIIEQMVALDYGWSVIPEYLCSRAIADGVIANVGVLDKITENSIYLVWNESSLGNPFVLKARDRIIEMAEAGGFAK
ncbi:LysR family transcriptional regulator [Serratia nevei]|uniref:LysR family transcriptional regulator n=1 Tax=Serratia nevei TaxID=2703794 RepID=UPI0020A01A6F|nr:LysR family transcriptional regulator [Serratia nevei]MCP1107753.1 LysR family transcriptional regulator [Serratia nevei]